MVSKTVLHYRIIERLGRGCMGVVSKAEDTKLKRAVALKLLPEDLSRDHQSPDTRERYAQAASASNHYHICSIYGIDEHESQPFIANAVAMIIESTEKAWKPNAHLLSWQAF